MTDLAELRKLLEAATPGPWGEDDCNIFSHPMKDERHDAIVRSRQAGTKYKQHRYPHPYEDTPYGWVASTQQRTPNSDADAALIVAAVNALPALLDEVERLRGALEDVLSLPAPWEPDCDCEGCVEMREISERAAAALVPKSGTSVPGKGTD